MTDLRQCFLEPMEGCLFLIKAIQLVLGSITRDKIDLNKADPTLMEYEKLYNEMVPSDFEVEFRSPRFNKLTILN